VLFGPHFKLHALRNNGSSQLKCGQRTSLADKSHDNTRSGIRRNRTVLKKLEKKGKEEWSKAYSTRNSRDSNGRH
jgi:hypothetical protein